jgi:transposase
VKCAPLDVWLGERVSYYAAIQEGRSYTKAIALLSDWFGRPVLQGSVSYVVNKDPYARALLTGARAKRAAWKRPVNTPLADELSKDLDALVHEDINTTIPSPVERAVELYCWENPKSRRSRELLSAIFTKSQEGKYGKQIADELGISTVTVSYIRRHAHDKQFDGRTIGSGPRHIPAETQARALELAETFGCDRAAHMLNLHGSTVRRWKRRKDALAASVTTP